MLRKASNQHDEGLSALLLAATELAEADRLIIVQDPDAMIAKQQTPLFGSRQREGLILRSRIGKRLVEAPKLPEQITGNSEVARSQEVALEAATPQWPAIGFGLILPVEFQPRVTLPERGSA